MLTRTEAEIVAIRAVEWLAADQDTFSRFLNATGETPDGVQRRLGDADFLAAAMDYLLASENAVMAFCRANNFSFDLPMQVRRALPGGDNPEWT